MPMKESFGMARSWFVVLLLTAGASSTPLSGPEDYSVDDVDRRLQVNATTTRYRMNEMTGTVNEDRLSFAIRFLSNGANTSAIIVSEPVKDSLKTVAATVLDVIPENLTIELVYSFRRLSEGEQVVDAVGVGARRLQGQLQNFRANFEVVFNRDIYSASRADLASIAVFSLTAAEWEDRILAEFQTRGIATDFPISVRDLVTPTVTRVFAPTTTLPPASAFFECASEGCSFRFYNEGTEFRYYRQSTTLTYRQCFQACLDDLECSGFEYPNDGSYCAHWMQGWCHLPTKPFSAGRIPWIGSGTTCSRKGWTDAGHAARRGSLALPLVLLVMATVCGRGASAAFV